MKPKSILEDLEENFVFNTSRYFFLVLVLLAMLGAVAGILFLLWGIIPAKQSTVVKDADPPPIVITATDVFSAPSLLKPQGNKDAEVPQTTSTQKEKAEVDSMQIRFQVLLDTLQMLLPGRFYSWQSTGHWTYPYGESMYRYSQKNEYRKWVADSPGIADKLKDFFAGESDYKVAIAPLEQLTAILRTYPEGARLKPFETFLDLYEARRTEYKAKAKENEEMYQARLADAESKFKQILVDKSVARYEGFIAIGSGLATVVCLAILLVLLSMQRAMKELLAASQKS